MRLLVVSLLALIALGVQFAFPLDITNTSGRVFLNAKVSEVRPDGLKITHSKGVALIAFRELPDAMQAEYRYDPAKEKEFQKRQAEQAALRSRQQLDKQLADAVATSGRDAFLEIIQITEDGALVKGHWKTEEQYETTEYRATDHNWITGQTHYSPETVKKTNVQRHSFPPQVFLVGVPSHLVDGDTYHTVIYPCGRYQYTTVMGGQATVERYATTISEARRLLGF